MSAVGPRLFRSARHGDARGWFSETWSRAMRDELGDGVDFVQENHSYSAQKGTLRGIHFQTPPHAQAKLVRCVRGRIIDVIVDLRMSSPTYGRSLAVELSAAACEQLFVPIGYGHGFVTMEPDTEVIYKVSAGYAPSHEGGLAWDCPVLGIEWPLPKENMILSDRDRQWPTLDRLEALFPYDGAPFKL